MVLVNTEVSEMLHCFCWPVVTDVTKEHNAIIIRVRHSTAYKLTQCNIPEDLYFHQFKVCIHHPRSLGEHIKCTEVKCICNKTQIDARHIVIHVRGATDGSVHSGHKYNSGAQHRMSQIEVFRNILFAVKGGI
jgi:hypothetical protein